MKRSVLLLLMSGLLGCAYAQNASIKGSVSDTANKQYLQNATVYLLRHADSVLYKFTRTNKEGAFEMHDLKTGHYVLMISYPHYVAFMDSVNLDGSQPLLVPPVHLMTESRLLEEVVVRHTIAPISMKGDTLEFVADSFKVMEGAPVEDLLKKFPGFTVDSKGQVTAQGQRIQRVLVDGDEFFGNDPTIATQNLNARDVAKVQLFDSKSDRATITGMDDGRTQKTLNLILKKNAKKQVFGQVAAGSDFNQYYQGKATVNKFDPTLKAGAYISTDRTGNNTMTYQENEDLGDPNAFPAIQGNSNNPSIGNNPWGIPENLTVAAMLNKKFGAANHSTVNNYVYNNQNNIGDETTNSKYILPDTVYYNKETQHFNDNQWSHTLHTNNELKLDSTGILKVNARAIWGHNEQSSNYNSQYLSADQQLVNSSNRITNSSTDNNSQQLVLTYNAKLGATKQRTLAVNAAFANNGSTTTGSLFNQTNFYKTGASTSPVVDEKKFTRNTGQAWQGIVRYTEPLTKQFSLNMFGLFNSSANDQDIRSYDNNNGVYDSLNPYYSNHYKFTSLSGTAGSSLAYKASALTANIGLAVQSIALKETNVYTDSAATRNFIDLNPQAGFTWKYSGSGNLQLQYNGYSQLPSLSQIQPIANNINPLNVILGNPDLKPAFTQSISLNLLDHKTLKNTYWFVRGSFSSTENAFSNKMVLDSLGRTISQTVNVQGNFNYSASIQRILPIVFLHLNAGMGPQVNGSRNNNFVNGLPNAVQTYAAGPWFFISKQDDKIDLNINYVVLYNHSVSSINPGNATNYWSHWIIGWANFNPSKNWRITSRLNTNIRPPLSPGDKGLNSTVWSMGLERKLLKAHELWLGFNVNDILNQHVGFTSSINSNLVTESNYTAVSRYFLLTLKWKFSKK